MAEQNAAGSGSGDQSPDDGALSLTLINQVFDLWVLPELERRGMPTTQEDIRKVLVELRPNSAPRVMLNEEAVLTATVRSTRDITRGDEVTEDDFDEVSDLAPHDLDPDSGWVCFAVIKNQRVAAFDFRYNKARARATLDRAREFLTVARNAADVSPAVALDNAYSAAELSVQAQMLTEANEPTRGHHDARLDWLRIWVEHQNGPEQHHHVLANLRDQRRHARYGGQPQLKPGRLTQVLVIVDEMITKAELRLD